jgi:hypothetical protein
LVIDNDLEQLGKRNFSNIKDKKHEQNIKVRYCKMEEVELKR